MTILDAFGRRPFIARAIVISDGVLPTMAASSRKLDPTLGAAIETMLGDLPTNKAPRSFSAAQTLGAKVFSCSTATQSKKCAPPPND
jgi:hypothetical protein